MKGMRIYLYFGLLLSLLWSCSVVEIQTVQPEPQPEPALVTFTLAMQQAGSTKADDNNWDGVDYIKEIGTAYENNIITSSVKVFAYFVSGDAVQFISEVPILQWGVTDDGLAQFQGYFERPQATGQYKFIVIANCTDKSYGLAYDYINGIPKLEDLVFDAPSLQEINSMTSAIPMYGITTYELSDATMDIDLGKVWMLRSLAKVEILLSDELKEEGYTIESATINRSNQAGYCLPAGWYNAVSTQAIVHDGAFRQYQAGSVTNSISMIPQNGNYYLYIPEIENTSPEPVIIGLTVNKSGVLYKRYDAGISFCNYSIDGMATDDLFNIVRNHIYRFTITGLTQPELEIKFAIWPWEIVYNFIDVNEIYNKN